MRSHFEPVETRVPRGERWPGPGPRPDFWYEDIETGAEYWPNSEDIRWMEDYREREALRKRVAELEAHPTEQSLTAKLNMARRLIGDVLDVAQRAADDA